MADDEQLNTPDTCPELEGWLTLPAAADEMRVSRAWVHQAAQRGWIHTLRKVGDRPLLIMKQAELAAVRDRMMATKTGLVPPREGRPDDESEVVHQDRATA